MELCVLRLIVRKHGANCLLNKKPLLFWCLPNYKALKWLLKHYANPNEEICIRDDKRVTALWLVTHQTRAQYPRKVRRLLRKYGAVSIRYSDFVAINISASTSKCSKGQNECL